MSKQKAGHLLESFDLYRENMKAAPSNLPTKFTMEFEPTTIEHLGLKLYSSLPPVIGELVSNSWDADAAKVHISIPMGVIKEGTEVIVRDDGNGMDPLELQQKYLSIGRNRRETEQADVSEQKRRPVTGRKGLGKLSGFGIADQIVVRTIKNGFATAIKLDYRKMKTWPQHTPYEPEILESARTHEANGTTITVHSLRRKAPISASWIRRELARRFRFIGPEFQVYINDELIKPIDRRRKEDCRAAWDVAELAPGTIVDTDQGWTVTGWIGIVEKSSQTDRGVDIFARDKAVELDTMFNLKTTHVQFARSYVVGEISAEFLDSDEDRISTARNSVNWESDAGQKLQQWGESALKDVFGRWLELQRSEKEEKIVRTTGFDKWLATRTKREQRVAQRLLKVIVGDPNIDPETAGPLLEIIKSNVEFQAFQDLVDDIEETGTSVRTLLKLFEDWRIIEAREHLKLSDGRLEAMEKLSGFIEEGALEVRDMQPIFEKNTWLIDPSWGSASGQTTYTALLRKEFPEPPKLDDKNRRLDILGVTVGSAVEVVELKRPEKKLSREDLEQVEMYVDWARGNLVGTGRDAPRYVRGLLIVGELSSKQEIKLKMERLAGSDIRVQTYKDLLHRARVVYGEVQNRLKSLAPEYSPERRRSRKGKKKSRSGKKKRSTK
jgi:hypothetical protein